MTKAPLVSVILPVRNGESFVAEAIDSVTRQTHQNIELVVVDDGSTDRTRPIVDSLARNDSRIRVISQEAAGVARARNRGIASARGDYIAPIDADDVWEPAKIEKQVERMLQSDRVGLVYTWWVWIDRKGVVLDRSPRWRVEGDAFETLLQVNFTGNASVPLFRRKCLEEVGGYNESLFRSGAGGCEDWELALKIADRYSVAVVPELLVGYRRRSDSMSSARTNMWRSQNAVLQAALRLRPGLSQSVIRRSCSQFALYLGGLSYWSGDYLQAGRWVMRACPSSLFFQALPYIVGMLLKRGFRRHSVEPQSLQAGVPIDPVRIAEPLIPYERFYSD
jgi:glycosyltransferase involved in cell wall biosynthesis